MEDEEARTVAVPHVWGKGVFKYIFNAREVLIVEVSQESIVVECVVCIQRSPYMKAVSCWTVRGAKV